MVFSFTRIFFGLKIDDKCKSQEIGNREVVMRLSKPLRGHLRHEVIDGSFRDEAVELESLPKIFV